MSRASQRNAWLIQHCYSPYGTTQLEKTGKKGSFWPQKAPFGATEVLGGSRGGRFGPDCPQSVPNGYPNPTRYPVFSSIPDPTRFNFENLRVAGNPKYRVLPEISGCKLFVNNPKYPELPESKKDTRKYPIVFFNTPTRPEPDPLPGIFSNTRPDPTRY